MVESVGKRLNRARLERHISVEEAAHATRMRPDRVLDLENDDYTNFPSLAYAKGFLVIYAKYLGVDVSDFASTLNATGRFGIENYDYLHNAPPPVPPVTRRKVRRGLLKPLIIVVVAVGGTVWVMNWISTLQRLGNIDDLARKQGGEEVPAATPAPPARPVATATPGATPPAEIAATPVPTPAEPTPVPVRVAEPVQPLVSPAPLADGTLEIRRAEPVNPAPSATPAARPVDLVLMPVKKTWVKVSAGKGDATPLFEDWLYPDVKPMKLHGTKFWIELGDRNGVVILRDDAPVHYQDPGVSIE